MAKEFIPDPKPLSTKKVKGAPSPKKEEAPTVVVADKTRTEINSRNRNFGKAVERAVAKKTGGTRTPGSGAIKNSVLNLEGDVRIRDSENKKDIIIVECKGSSGLTTKGDKTYTLKKSVLHQMIKEAELTGSIGVLYLHFLNEDYTEDYCIIKSNHFYDLVRLARIGATHDN